MAVLRALFIGLVALTLGAAAPGGRDWSRTVAIAPSGGYLLGNPNARVRLVEYLSYTCPHCARFSAEGSGPLRTGYVVGGKVGVEFRNAVRDPADLAAALLARCGGPRRFFGNSEAIFAAQDDWLTKAAAMTPPDGTPDDRLRVFARDSGLIALMQRRGFTPAQLDRCLTDKVERQRVTAMTNDAWDVRKIPYTPAIFINDRLPDHTTTWAALEPLLRAAVK